MRKSLCSHSNFGKCSSIMSVTYIRHKNSETPVNKLFDGLSAALSAEPPRDELSVLCCCVNCVLLSSTESSHTV